MAGVKKCRWIPWPGRSDTSALRHLSTLEPVDLANGAGYSAALEFGLRRLVLPALIFELSITLEIAQLLYGRQQQALILLPVSAKWSFDLGWRNAVCMLRKIDDDLESGRGGIDIDQELGL